MDTPPVRMVTLERVAERITDLEPVTAVIEVRPELPWRPASHDRVSLDEMSIDEVATSRVQR